MKYKTAAFLSGVHLGLSLSAGFYFFGALLTSHYWQASLALLVTVLCWFTQTALDEVQAS